MVDEEVEVYCKVREADVKANIEVQITRDALEVVVTEPGSSDAASRQVSLIVVVLCLFDRQSCCVSGTERNAS